jgi:hypothetical protein
MTDPDKATATQLANIAKRSGKSLEEFAALVSASGLTKHSEIREMLTRDVGLGYGDANAMALYVLALKKSAAGAAPATIEDIVSGFYAGAKSSLRPIHDRLMAEIARFGEFEIAPKKNYVSLRRKRQFGMIGPATNTRVEVGLNVKGVTPTERLVEMPPNSMCNYTVKVTTVAEVDATLIGWLKQAYDSAS